MEELVTPKLYREPGRSHLLLDLELSSDMELNSGVAE
jgi:hypothetical protein